VYLAHEQIEFYILHVINMAVPEPTLPSAMQICHAYFNNCNTPVWHIYMNNINTQVRPKEWTFYYDFRNWSLAGFQAAGWNNIETNWSYSFTSNWLQQTNGSNDRRETAWVNIPDISWASSITIESLWYYRAASWSNNKRVIIADNNSRSASSNNRLYWQMAMNTSSPSRYNSYWIWWFWVDKVREYINWAQWDTTQNLNINLKTWLVTYTNTWANTKNYTYTMSSSELATLKTRRWVWFEKERWYSSYNDEALKTIWVTIHY
jgi:hypothetical protein